MDGYKEHWFLDHLSVSTSVDMGTMAMLMSQHLPSFPLTFSLNKPELGKNRSNASVVFLNLSSSVPIFILCPPEGI